MVQVRGAKTQQLKAQKSAPGGHQEQNREIRQGPDQAAFGRPPSPQTPYPYLTKKQHR